MSILLVGVNHKTAPVEIRERLAFNDEACAAGLRRLVDGDVVREGLIVSTCNRVEILSATADRPDRLWRRTRNAVSRYLRQLAAGFLEGPSVSAHERRTPCVTCFALPLHWIRWSSASRRCWARCVTHTRWRWKPEQRVEFSIGWSITRFASPSACGLKPESRQCRLDQLHGSRAWKEDLRVAERLHGDADRRGRNGGTLRETSRERGRFARGDRESHEDRARQLANEFGEPRPFRSIAWTSCFAEATW